MISQLTVLAFLPTPRGQTSGVSQSTLPRDFFNSQFPQALKLIPQLRSKYYSTTS
ncbi:hypothetical protein BJX76DRAFT_335009, partial [Aspergillus varians]